MLFIFSILIFLIEKFFLNSSIIVKQKNNNEIYRFLTKSPKSNIFKEIKLNFSNKTNLDIIKDVIESLKNAGIKTAVISNKTDPAVQSLIKEYFPGLFLYVAGEKEGIKRKPAPDAVFSAINELGVSITDTVYVGDSEVDILTAENAGTDCICVSWGFRDKEQLISKGADTVISHINELKDMLLK